MIHLKIIKNVYWDNDAVLFRMFEHKQILESHDVQLFKSRDIQLFK